MARENDGQVAEAAQEFPDIFGLRAFPGDRFKILLGASYLNEDGVQLYTGILKDGNWLSFAKGTPAELRKEVVPLPPEEIAQPTSAPGRTGGDSWREILHGPVDYIVMGKAIVAAARATTPTPVMEKKPKDMIDPQARADLRLLLVNRMSWIDQTYPHSSVWSYERHAALEALIHLTHELGFDCEGLLWDEERQ